MPLLNNEIFLVGHSLGAIFLTKYLSENKVNKKVIGTFLIATPYDDKTNPEPLGDFKLKYDFTKLVEQGGRAHFYQSTDDKVVPYEDFLKYKEKVPEAKYIEFTDRGHFNQEEFPELVEDIKKIF
ncbi:MAG: hypothetical protein JWN37_692 [Candidatus Nomurabacteria bacterium]|nr:hypothetical protein [Candidatus Nomurabacteria bacterium]